ncbi:MAG: anthranilate synthase component I family protein [Acidimicrobiia bacterium]
MDTRPADTLAVLEVLGAADAPVAVLRRGDGWLVAWEPVEVVEGHGAAVLDAIEGLAPGLWAGFLAFELGRAVEAVRPGRASATAATVPDGLLVRFARHARVPTLDGLLPRSLAPVRLGPADRSSLGRAEYLVAVDTVLEHIRAGDCYQVNVTRTLEWDTAADPVAVFGALARRRPAPHAGLLRLPSGTGTTRATVAVVSASPERFLSWRGAEVETRPIKGTAAHPAALERSAKDHAENVMIVDLARNDLGRVCVPGSIHVPALCAVERHPGLAHLVSTVRGTLRADVGLGGLLRATLPPASISGAPKPRVLQIIEDLETVPRGVYCGATGWIDTEHHTGDLAVAIRTFTVAGGRTTLGVGGGIVADSDPAREWDETCLKARRLLARTGAADAAPVEVLA